MKNKDVIKKLNSLHEPLDQKEFLDSLSSRLKVYMELHPIRKERKGVAVPTPYYTTAAFFRFVSVSLVIVLLLSGSGIAYASQRSLPGDALYPIKTATEHIQVLLSTSAARKAELNVVFAQRRLDEIQQITEKRGAEEWRIKIAEDSLKEHVAVVEQLVDEQPKNGMTDESKKEVTFELGIIEKNSEKTQREDKQRDGERVEGTKIEREELHAETLAPAKGSPIDSLITHEEETKKEEVHVVEQVYVASDTVASTTEKQENLEQSEVKNEPKQSPEGDGAAR